ncbi:SH2 domain-containing protein A [Glycine soja]|uniref:SH2 domain-containing protein A n=1 Tax=Glycine soja TaxID=3848 RepID=A0A445GWM8_GLYSO|nr:SH2 domain-containing protein A [Glycine soja]
MDTDAVGSEGYSPLKELRLEIEVKEGTFSLCFWLYLTSSTTFPVTIIQQVFSDISESAPFLVIDDNKRIHMLPVLLLHEEAPETGNINSWTEVPHATVDFEFLLEKWVHVGCEVCPDHIQLQINGEIVGEKSLCSLLNKESGSSHLKKLTLANVGGDGKSVQGYVHNFEIFPIITSIKDCHLKCPPLKLSIDESSVSEIEEESDGVWGIVGGKASCRRNFSLDVVLSDAFGQPVDKENEVFASLLYADTGAPVENTADDEAPLLASYDGIEFSSCERPSKLLLGRASFKLKISQNGVADFEHKAVRGAWHGGIWQLQFMKLYTLQSSHSHALFQTSPLSSKCDNRLFLISFCVPKLGNYPFLEAYSRPIRCISRSRNTRVSTLVWKRSTALHCHSLSQSSAMDDRSLDLQHSSHEAQANPLMKRFRLGQDKTSVSVKADPTIEQPDEECNSHVRTANQVENGFPTSLDGRSANFIEAEDSPSDSESIGEGKSPLNSMASRRNPISDMTIFKYCLASLAERSLMLKEIATFASGKEISELANHVSLYSGCSHHGSSLTGRLSEDESRGKQCHALIWRRHASDMCLSVAAGVKAHGGEVAGVGFARGRHFWSSRHIDEKAARWWCNSARSGHSAIR